MTAPAQVIAFPTQPAWQPKDPSLTHQLDLHFRWLRHFVQGRCNCGQRFATYRPTDEMGLRRTLVAYRRHLRAEL